MGAASCWQWNHFCRLNNRIGMAMGCSAKVQRLGAATAPSLPRLSQARALTNVRGG